MKGICLTRAPRVRKSFSTHRHWPSILPRSIPRRMPLRSNVRVALIRLLQRQIGFSISCASIVGRRFSKWLLKTVPVLPVKKSVTAPRRSSIIYPLDVFNYLQRSRHSSRSLWRNREGQWRQTFIFWKCSLNTNTSTTPL